MITLNESRFTPPSVWCPAPDRWHSSDGASTEHEVTELVAGFVRALQPDLVVETGTAFGQTAEAIGQALVRNGHGRLVTLEPVAPRIRKSVARCEGLPVTVVPVESLSWTPEPGDVIGFAWFDSLLELRATEFEHFRPWMTTATVVGFHDTGPQHPLQPDIERLEAAGLIKPIRLHTPRGVTFAEVL